MKKEKQESVWTVDEAVVALERFCAYQDRYTQEIRQKLHEYQIPEPDADVILNYLINENYINEARFTDAFVRGKIRSNHWGKVKIRIELRMKGIHDRWINAALEAFPEQEYLEILKKLATQKVKECKKHLEIVQRQKVNTYLQRAGWEQDLVIEVLDQLFGRR